MIVVVLAALMGIYFAKPHLSDSSKLTVAFDQSLADGSKGEPSSALEMVSNQFTLNGSPESRGDIANAIQKFHPQLTVDHRSLSINGSTASITGEGNLQINIGPLKKEVQIPQIQFNFTKIPDKIWLFIPSTHWVLKSVQVPTNSMSQAESAISQLTNSGF